MLDRLNFLLKSVFKEHAKADSLIGRAIRKYGEEQFDYEVLETCETRDEAYAIEIFYINHFVCISPNGYNLTEGSVHSPCFDSFTDVDDWVIWYRGALKNLALEASKIATKVLLVLASKQEFEGGIKTTKKAIVDELKISYDNVLIAFR